jgi:hypothetical protein
MSGALSLWLLSLLREQRESDSPRGETKAQNHCKSGVFTNCFGAMGF